MASNATRTKGDIQTNQVISIEAVDSNHPMSPAGTRCGMSVQLLAVLEHEFCRVRCKAHNFLRLKVGSIYSVKNFMVKPNKEEYQILKNDMYKLEFDGLMTIRKALRQSIRVMLWSGLGDVLIEKKTKTSTCPKMYNSLEKSKQNSATPIDLSQPQAMTLENLLMWARNKKNNVHNFLSNVFLVYHCSITSHLQTLSLQSITFHCKVTIDGVRTRKGWNFPSCGSDTCTCLSLMSKDNAQVVAVMFNEIATVGNKYPYKPHNLIPLYTFLMARSYNDSDHASIHNEAPNNHQQPNIQPQIITTVSNNNLKFPYLKKDEYEVWAMKMEYWITNNDMNIWKKDEYEVWAMKMEYWITNNDMNIWKVIQNGNNLKRTRKGGDRGLMILPPMTAEEHLVNAVKARFGGNAESKKMRKSMLKQEFSEFRISETEGFYKGYDRMQKILSQLNQLDAKPNNEEINLRFLRALPSSWFPVALTLKTKGGLEFLSFDDLYCKLKTLEVDIKGYNTFSSRQSTRPSHSAFVTTTSTNKKMSYGDSLTHSSTTTYSVPSNSKTGSYRTGNIEKLDLEEMDLKWQMAMLSVRVHKFEQKAGRKIDFDKKESARSKGGNDKQRYSSFKNKETRRKEEDLKALVSVDTLVDWLNHDSDSDEVFTAKEFGMIAGCDSADVIKAGANKVYHMINGANAEKANTPGDAGEFALMGVTFQMSTPVPTGRPYRPFPVSTDRGYSPSTYTPYIPTMYYNNMQYGGDRWETVVKPSSGCSWKPYRKGFHWETPFSATEDEGIFDSGCSRSMTGNKDRLDDFQAIHGGKVTFGGCEGRITGKGIIRTPTLDFENVYYVKELQQLNLLSISQICDKKNQVLFTDTECLAPHSSEYVPKDHVPVFVLEFEHPEDLVPAEDEAPASLLPPV
nr:hypothetical protein [Tanacetum cinerariifolium]